MAFEIPLDADKVDDLNIFSTLVRAPVIGTLMWMFGGAKGQQHDGDEEIREHCLEYDDGDEYYDNSISNHQSGTKYSKQYAPTLKKAAPSLLGSEISESELVESLDAVSLYGYAGSHLSNYNTTTTMPKKELSWSDDVGKNLVVYEDESTIHEPKPCHEQPTRPSLVRSRSIRSDANNLMNSQIDNKFLPTNPHRPNKPLMKHHTMPYPMHHQTVEPYSSGTNGYDSPQWGWYINTTPPSPEMFHTSRNKARKGVDSSSDTSDISRDSALTTISGNNAPNPVFQCLQDKHKATPAGWPSVPL